MVWDVVDTHIIYEAMGMYDENVNRNFAPGYHYKVPEKFDNTVEYCPIVYSVCPAVNGLDFYAMNDSKILERCKMADFYPVHENLTMVSTDDPMGAKYKVQKPRPMDPMLFVETDGKITATGGLGLSVKIKGKSIHYMIRDNS